jgi:hypothetical protein
MKNFTKLFRGVVKSFDEKTHKATILISTGDIDRDMEVIEPKAFLKNIGTYLAHPVLLSSHRADQLTRNIGMAHAIRVTDQGVEGDYEWFVGKGNPEADWGWFLVTRGIAAFSVGFMAKAYLDKWSAPMISPEDSARGIQRRFTEIELLENSQVLVPCNPNALQRQLTDAKGEEKELLELVVKTVKSEEMVPFDKPEPARKVKNEGCFKIKFSQTSVELCADILRAFPDLEIEDVTGKAIQVPISSPEHYSRTLLGAGDPDPIQTPTEEKPKSDESGFATPSTKEIIGAIKSGVEEGLKS